MSIVKSGHKAVLALPDHFQSSRPKCTISPAQHALLKHAACTNLTNLQFFTQQPAQIHASTFRHNVQAEFDHFYGTALSLLNQFYPGRVINLTSRDPDCFISRIKAKLRRKNRLMHGGRAEEAGTLLRRIGTEITRCCQSRLSKLDNKSNDKDVGSSMTVDWLTAGTSRRSRSLCVVTE